MLHGLMAESAVHGPIPQLLETRALVEAEATREITRSVNSAVARTGTAPRLPRG
jgi:hypothetical protein